MSFFQRLRESLGGAKPVDNMAKDFPEEAFTPAEGLSAYPRKTRLSDRGLFAYRLEFVVASSDAPLVARTIGTEFDLPSPQAFQQGEARRPGKALHFSIRPEFGGAVVVMVTNSVSLLAQIDALRLEPPPPWTVFPDEDASTLGSLQGSMDYWWDRLFLPFWSAADAQLRLRYLDEHPATPDWLEFLETHAPEARSSGQ